MATLGRRIRIRREVMGMNQKQFADLLGVHLSSLSYYEADKRQPTLDTLLGLSRLLGVSTDYLLKGDSLDQDTQEEAVGTLVRTIMSLSPNNRELALRILKVFITMDPGRSTDDSSLV